MTARHKLPAGIYSVPVTLFVLVEGRGFTEGEKIADAKVQAAKWAGNQARYEIGEPTKF